MLLLILKGVVLLELAVSVPQVVIGVYLTTILTSFPFFGKHESSPCLQCICVSSSNNESPAPPRLLRKVYYLK